jgi:hypothetical protein
LLGTLARLSSGQTNPLSPEFEEQDVSRRAAHVRMNITAEIWSSSLVVIETHEHAGEFKESYDSFFSSQATILDFLDDPVEAARRFWIL